MLGKDQAEFCDFIGIGLSTLRRIEQNNGNINLATVEKILKKFSLQLVVKTMPR